MSEKQRAKHIADREAVKNAQTTYYPVSSSLLDAADPTPDSLGPYEGGRIALQGSNRWVAEKSHAQRTADSKNMPGTDYATKITHRQDRDFTEIHVEDGKVLLYNVKTDAWDIEGDSSDMPNYEDENGILWAYNAKTGAWDVPVAIEDAIA